MVFYIFFKGGQSCGEYQAMHSETKVAVHAFNATISATERCWLVSMPGLIPAAFFKRSDESWASCHRFVPTCAINLSF